MFFIAIVIPIVILYLRQFTRNPQHSPIRLSRTIERPKNSRLVKTFSAGEKILDRSKKTLDQQEQISKDQY